jgi:hypothetical protein
MHNFMHRFLTVLSIGFVACHAAMAQTAPRAPVLGQPQVISNSGEATRLEIPIAQPLPSHSQVRLASPESHAQMGVPYPNWLGDASFEIKPASRQRQALHVQAKRINPATANDMVLEFYQDGVVRRKAYSFLLDSADAAPNAAADANRVNHAQPAWKERPLPHAVAFENAPAANKPTAKPKRKSGSAAKSADAPTADAAKAATAASPALASNAVNAPLAFASSATATPVVAAPVAQNATAPAPAPAKPKTASMWDWLLEWQTLAIGFVAISLLGLLFYRFKQKREERRTAQVTAFAQQTRFQVSKPEVSQANTVFGLTDQEAQDLQKSWLDRQLGGKP